MSKSSQQSTGDLNVIVNQKQPLKRTNITVVQMNKSKIKFLNKYLSKSEMGIYKNAQSQSIAPHDQYSLQFRMKQKFEQLYKRIQRISRNVNNEQLSGKYQKRFLVSPNQQIFKRSSNLRNTELIKNQLLKVGSRIKSKSPQVLKVEEQEDNTQILQINTLNQQKQQQYLTNFKIINSNRYKSRMICMSKPFKMSNNIKDYLSVEKIRLKDLQDSMIQKQHNINERTKVNKLRSSLYCDLTSNLSNQIKKCRLPNLEGEKMNENKIPIVASNSIIRSKLKKFEPPFQTYYYRDLLWRIAYSNQKILESPEEYQSKIKVFVEKGNNSRLVKSIIARRSWYQITQKIQEAQVIWTQLKVQSIFNSQPKCSNKSQIIKNIKNSQNLEVYKNKLIWTSHEEKVFSKYFFSYSNAESRMKENFRFRNKTMIKIWDNKQQHSKKQSKQLFQTKNSFQTYQNHHNSPSVNSYSMPSIYQSTAQNFSSFNSKVRVHNHFINSFLIGNKKALFQTMTDYYTNKGDDVFNYLPLTFHICNGLQDQKYLKFLNYYYAIVKKSQLDQNKNSRYNAWIVKPGQNTNRGHGITVCLTLQSIKAILKKKDKHPDGSYKTYIVQKYIQRPMLYKKRKFDIRHYIMINCSNGFVKGYWFKQGYVRTTSSQYTLKQGLGSVHLTNDAVQKNLPDYGKFEKGNKISYEDLSQYLQKMNPQWLFWDQCYPQMKKIATDVIRASANNLDPQRRTNFQIYGLDFMIDQQMHVWLIQVNTNPCLELSCPLLAKIIPKMVQNTLQICLDPMYPPPLNFFPKNQTFKQNCLEQIQYQLVYDERFQQKNKYDSRLLNDETLKKQQDDCFDDDGQDWNQD